jgi:hypothetical protein
MRISKKNYSFLWRQETGLSYSTCQRAAKKYRHASHEARYVVHACSKSNEYSLRYSHFLGSSTEKITPYNRGFPFGSQVTLAVRCSSTFPVHFWCRNFDASERSEMRCWKKGWRTSINRSCEKWSSVTRSQGEEEYPTHLEGGRLTGLITSCVGTAFYTYNTLLRERNREVPGRRGRRRKQLLDELKRKRKATEYWKRKQ